MTFISSEKMHLGERSVCCRIPSNAAIRCNMVGTREPLEPFAQPRRLRDDFVLFLMIRGEITLQDEMPEGPDRWILKPGDLHSVGPGIWQTGLAPFPPGSLFLWIHFMVDAPCQYLGHDDAMRNIRALFSADRPARPQRFWLLPRHFSLAHHIDRFASLHQAIKDGQLLWGLEDRGVQTLALGFLYEIHRHYADSLYQTNPPSDDPTHLHASRARTFIRLNAERILSTRDVASALRINSAYLSRCFKTATGTTIGDFIRRAKVDAAMRLLMQEYRSIKEIASMTGFNSSTYFGRVFKEHTGCTAETFRTRYLRTVRSDPRTVKRRSHAR